MRYWEIANSVVAQWGLLHPVFSCSCDMADVPKSASLSWFAGVSSATE